MKVNLLGAGGKIGGRLTANLRPRKETLALERTWATESLHHLSTLATESLGPPS